MSVALFVVVFLVASSMTWGTICKYVAGYRGLDKDTAFLLGFLFWMLGLLIVCFKRTHKRA